MTAFTSRTLARHASLWDLAAIWVTLTATLAYLEVPLVNAPLFATALVLQAALGTVVITRLLKGAQPSLLMLLGPGLILGGALSFAIFQVVGRGGIGFVVTLLVGLASTAALASQRCAGKIEVSFGPTLQPRWWMLVQLTSLSGIAICGKFPETLPISAALFLIGWLTFSPRHRKQFRLVFGVVIGVFVACVSFVVRPQFWWMASDDYQFFEVIASHLMVSSPLENWGAMNFSKYHWLSYGWAGLLTYLGGQPDPFVTLTRVMPIVYSVSMVSSLFMVAKLLRKNIDDLTLCFAVFAVVSLGRFDWSGTSTGGAYAAIAATAWVAIGAVHPGALTVGRASLATIFIGILALTKFTALFAISLLIILTLGFVISERIRGKRWRRLVRLSIYLTTPCLLSLILFLLTLSSSLQGRFEVVSINPALGQLALFGKSFAGPALLLSQLPVWLAGAFFMYQSLSCRTRERPLKIWWGLSLLLAAFCGLILELVVTANADNHTYFSGPMYFVASLAFLGIEFRTRGLGEFRPTPQRSPILGLSLVATGLLWHWAEASQGLWNIVERLADDTPNLKVQLLKFVTADSRFIATVLVVPLALALKNRYQEVVGAWITALVILTLSNLVAPSLAELRHRSSPAQVDAQLGSTANRSVGRWLKDNSLKTDVVGTNSLRNPEGGENSDFSMAVWSHREFLILGPRFFVGDPHEKDNAVRISNGFAERPTASSCEAIQNAGVKWFIVDTRLTATRDWSVCSDMRMKEGNLIVLQIHPE